MSKHKRFRLNGNNWLLLVVFALASLFAAVELLVVLAGTATVINLFLAGTCTNKQNWDEEAFSRNLTEAAIDDKLVSLILWSLIWAILLRFEYNGLVIGSVYARSLVGIFIRTN